MIEVESVYGELVGLRIYGIWEKIRGNLVLNFRWEIGLGIYFYDWYYEEKSFFEEVSL